MNARYVMISRFCEMTGYTDRAVRRKIEDGVWMQNVQYRKAPDGHIFIDMDGFEKWVEGRARAPVPATAP